MSIVVRLFGPPTIERSGQRIDLDTRKAIALLAYLALAARPVSRSALAALLWPDYDATRAAANLRRTLWSLNTALDDDLLDTGQDAIALVPSPDLFIDVVAFNRQLAATRNHGHAVDEPCAACRASLAEATELARGDFLEGFSLRDAVEFDDWQSLTTVSLRNALADALRRLADAHVAAGDLGAACAAAERRAALDPLDQAATCQHMQLLAWTDRHAAALRVYRELERQLQGELGVAPDAEVAELFAAIKARQEPPPPPGPASAIAFPQNVADPAPLPAFLAEARPAQPPIFVAREHELAALEAHLAASRHGQGRLIFVTGEAGQGKTALLNAFMRRAVEAHPDLVAAMGACNAYTGAGDPYLPFRELLELLSGDVELRTRGGSFDPEQARRLWRLMPATVAALLGQGPDLFDTFVPVRPLLTRSQARLAPDQRQALETRSTRPPLFDPTLQQASLFEQVTRVLAALARRTPLLLVLDDLQWGDAGTLALLFHLSRRLAGVPLLLLGAFRPNDVAMGRQGERHPLEPIVHEVQRVQGASLVDLGQAQDRAFVDALLDSEPNHLDDAFRRELYRQTGGHPLFTGELLRGMQERGDLVRDASGAWCAQPTLEWRHLPARVEAVIAERIGRLPLELRGLLRAASVEGEAFSAEVAARLAGMDEAEARRRLSSELDREHRLVRALGVQRVGAARLTRYRFHHYLIQRSLYAGLDDAERMTFNEDAGRLLEGVYAGRTEEIAVTLAHHFDEAGIPDRAIVYYQQAGDRALRFSANAEAAELYGRALTLLAELPATPDHLQQELSLQAAYSVPLQHLEGWASPRVDAAFERALELARLFGNPPATLPLLGRIAHAWVYRGEHRRAMALAQELLSLAAAHEDDAILLEAHTVVGLTHFYLGEFSAALPHLELALQLYDPAAHAHLTYLYGQDAGVHVGLYRMLTLTMLGYLDQARAQAEATLAQAEGIGHPFTMAFAWSFAALRAALMLDTAPWHTDALRSLAVARAHAFPTWTALGLTASGLARGRMGEVAAGYVDAILGLEQALPTGAQATLPFLFGLLSELYIAMDQPEDALSMLEAGLSMAEANEEGLSLADLYRRRGELLLAMGRDWDAADVALQTAIRLSRRQEARLHELRALTARLQLARSHAPGEIAAARDALARVYGWFTEGSTAPDLLAAAAALADSG